MLGRIAVSLRTAVDFRPHTACVTHLSIIGNQILSASLDGTMKLHELVGDRWQVVREYDGHSEGIQHVLRLGAYFISCGDEGRVCLHHLSSSDPIASQLIARTGLNSTLLLPHHRRAPPSAPPGTIIATLVAAADSGSLVVFTLAVTGLLEVSAQAPDGGALGGAGGTGGAGEWGKGSNEFVAWLNRHSGGDVKARLAQLGEVKGAHDDAVNRVVWVGDGRGEHRGGGGGGDGGSGGGVVAAVGGDAAITSAPRGGASSGSGGSGSGGLVEGRDWRGLLEQLGGDDGLFASIGDDGRVALWESDATVAAAAGGAGAGGGAGGGRGAVVATGRGGAAARHGGDDEGDNHDDDDDDDDEEEDGDGAAAGVPAGCVARVECGGDAVSVAVLRGGSDVGGGGSIIVGVRHVAVVLDWCGAPRARLGGTEDYVRQVYVGGLLVFTATDDGHVVVYRRGDVERAVLMGMAGEGGVVGGTSGDVAGMRLNSDTSSPPRGGGDDEERQTGLVVVEPAYDEGGAHAGEAVFAMTCGAFGGDVYVLSGDNEGRIVGHAVETSAA